MVWTPDKMGMGMDLRTAEAIGFQRRCWNRWSLP